MTPGRGFVWFDGARRGSSAEIDRLLKRHTASPTCCPFCPQVNHPPRLTTIANPAMNRIFEIDHVVGSGCGETTSIAEIGGGGGGGGVGGGVGGASNDLPQFLQNFAATALTVAQLGQLHPEE